MHRESLEKLGPHLYPGESEHTRRIEEFFGDQSHRPLTPEEQDLLGELHLCLIVFTNRSGSTYLAELLHLMGVVATPRSEPFNHPEAREAAVTFHLNSFTDYFIALMRQNRLGARVGLKIDIYQLFWLSTLGLLNEIRRISLIHSTRRNVLTQAVSHYKARQTGQWHSRMGAGKKQVEYSGVEIARCLYAVTKKKQLFNYFCALHNHESISVVYEDIIEHPRSGIQRIAEFLELDDFQASAINLDDITIRKQGNDANRDLEHRFIREFSFAGQDSLSAWRSID